MNSELNDIPWKTIRKCKLDTVKNHNILDPRCLFSAHQLLVDAHHPIKDKERPSRRLSCKGWIAQVVRAQVPQPGVSGLDPPNWNKEMEFEIGQGCIGIHCTIAFYLHS